MSSPPIEPTHSAAGGSAPPPDPSAARPASSWPRRLLQWAYVGILACVAIAMLVIWSPVDGAIAGIGALPVLVAEAGTAALVLMTIVWFALFSRLPRGVRVAALGMILMPLGALIASIRDVEFTADMVVTPVFRWERLQTDLVEEDRRRESATPAAAVVVPPVTPEDMPGYRGANRDGIVAGPPIRADWSEHPPRELWKRPIGEGYSQFVVLGNLLVTMEQRTAGESVVCYFADTGREAWIHQTAASFDEVQGGAGPRSTPQIDDDRLYTLGATGELICLQLQDGRPVWTRNLLESTGIQNAQWGMTSSPLIVDDQLIVNIGSPIGNGLLSFDKRTGALRWQTTGIGPKSLPMNPSLPSATVRTVPVSTEGSADESRSSARRSTSDSAPPQNPPPGEASGEDHAVATGSALAGYSSPMVAEVDGVRQILNFDGIGLFAHDLQDGHVLWSYPFRNPPGVNVAQPIVLQDGTILITASYGAGAMRLRVARNRDGGEWTVTPAWSRPSTDLKAKMASCILHDGYVYGLDEGILVCLNPETGKRTWKGGRYGHGQLLLSAGKLIVLTEKGELVLVDPSPKKHQELARFQALPSDVKTWNPFAISRGILYVRNHHWMAAYDVRETP